MALNSAGLVVLANALQETLLFAQLHDGAAGVGGTANIAVAGREPIAWDTPDGLGAFGLLSSIDFTAGTPGGPVYSVTLWGEETDGTFYGEFPITSGDAVFNGAGEYSVTVIDWEITEDL